MIGPGISSAWAGPVEASAREITLVGRLGGLMMAGEEVPPGAAPGFVPPPPPPPACALPSDEPPSPVSLGWVGCTWPLLPLLYLFRNFCVSAALITASTFVYVLMSGVSSRIACRRQASLKLPVILPV